jgi:putative ABC transport system permease protein
VTGGIIGGVLGVAGIWALRAWYGRFVEDLDRALPYDSRTFVIAVSISLAAGIVAGLYPAWRIGRAAPASYLKVQ